MSDRLKTPQRGIVLITALLMLVVVTVLAIALFHSFGLDEKIAGNTREKQRALQAAISAEEYAEWWLSVGNAVSNVTCSGVVAVPTVQVCTNTLATSVPTGNVAVLPWTIAGAAVGDTYTPPGMTIATGSSIGAGTYYQTPVFYIAYLGVGVGANNTQGNVYQIDAAAYGGSPSTAAVVESTYILQTSDQYLSGGQ